MFAAMSLLMLLVPVLGGTSTGIEPPNSDPSCLLQKVTDQALSKGAVCEDCYCTSNPEPSDPLLGVEDLSECEAHCLGFPGFTARLSPVDIDILKAKKMMKQMSLLGTEKGIMCWCCDDLAFDVGVAEETGFIQGVFTVDVAVLEGDPHIKTLDGRHYTLLKQGTYSLWHFSGVDAVASQEGQVNKVPVDWHIYSHYSGSQSFTKGLLLVDKSGGSVKQVLEFTSRDCEWRARSPKDDWKAVSDEPLAAPHAGTEFVVSKKSGAKGHNHVRLNLKTQKGKTEVAVLSLSCRPHHSINLQLVMKNRADNRFVDGEMQTGRRDFSKLAMIQTSTSQDSEFAVQDSWQSLGGSEQAALYLEMDQAQAPMSLLSMPCTGEKEDAAKKTCSKHLGDMDKDQTIFQDCVFDVCHGGDETVAELAAELRDSTRAI